MKKLATLKELAQLIIEKKKWWLAPIILLLLLCAGILGLAQLAPVAPILYTIF